MVPEEDVAAGSASRAMDGAFRDGPDAEAAASVAWAAAWGWRCFFFFFLYREIPRKKDEQTMNLAAKAPVSAEVAAQKASGSLGVAIISIDLYIFHMNL